MISKTLRHDKKHQLILTDIGSAWYLKHLEARDFFFKYEYPNIIYQQGVI